MRRRLAVLATLALLSAVLPGLGAPPASAQQVQPCDLGGSSEFSTVSPRPRHDLLPQEVVSIPSAQDGADIQIGVFRPRVPAGTRVPVIVRASPYFHPMQELDLRVCEPFLIENYVPQGYAVGLVALRGTADSGGCFDFFGSLERQDLAQAVSWLGSRPWSNGRVGMVGKSSDGGSQWEVASIGSPYLKTIVPVSGVVDVFDLQYGGANVDVRGGILAGVYFAQSLGYAQGRSPQHTAGVAACPEYATAVAASLYSSVTGDEDLFGYWADRRYSDDILERYRGSVFFIHGLQDWNVNPGTQFPFILDLKRRGVPVKTLLGQWGHAFPDEATPPSLRRDFADILLRWFDRWLKGRKVDTGPAAQVEDSDGLWRNERSWPPAGRTTRLWLTPDGALAAAPGGAGSAMVAPSPLHVSDPLGNMGAGVGLPPLPAELQAVCQAPVCAAFRTEPMAGAYRIAGLPRLRVPVTPAGPLGNLAAFLLAEGPDGLRRLGWGQVDLRFPRGRGASQTVTPGTTVEIDAPLQPLDAVLHPGERLVLMVTMANSGNRLPGLGLPATLELGAESSLTIVRVTPRPSQFFEPPAEPEA